MQLRRWAPYPSALSLEVNGRLIPGEPDPGLLGEAGWYTFDVPELAHGVDYTLVADGEPIPDPLARWLPEGVHAAARFFDPAQVDWTDDGWVGRSLDIDAVIYELHVGTFTRGGTLDHAAAQLAELAELGISHVELMPLAAFDGTHGWGYDGVALNAVHEPYGGPAALCRFVDRAHELGLAVVLDVVHNHLGPSGNYWDVLGPWFTDQQQTPWGQAVNLDGPGSDNVRTILLDSAVSWLRDFHLDGLRLDAVHELRDDRAVHYLEELSSAVDDLSAQLRRPLVLIAESDRNDPRTVTARSMGGLGLTAQWDDDIHHALHWLLTGESTGYYGDFASLDAVRQAFEGAFLHQGGYSTFRGRTHGRPVNFALTPPSRFVAALQTHDQVGNRARGERLSQLVPFERLAAGAALLITLPYIPMLFMGEEWGSLTPWCYFTSFPDPALAHAVTEGRAHEFGAHGWSAEVPDPQDPQTFERSVLRWHERQEPGHATLLAWYQALIRWRRGQPTDEPARCRFGVRADGAAAWVLVHVGPRWVIVNLDAEPASVTLPNHGGVMPPVALDLAWPVDSVTLAAGVVTLAAGSVALLS